MQSQCRLLSCMHSLFENRGQPKPARLELNFPPSHCYGLFLSLALILKCTRFGSNASISWFLVRTTDAIKRLISSLCNSLSSAEKGEILSWTKEGSGECTQASRPSKQAKLEQHLVSFSRRRPADVRTMYGPWALSWKAEAADSARGVRRRMHRWPWMGNRRPIEAENRLYLTLYHCIIL